MAIEKIPGLIQVKPNAKIPAEKPELRSPNPLWAVGGGVAGLAAGSMVGGVIGLAASSSTGSSAIGTAVTIVGALAGAALGAASPYLIANKRFEQQAALFGPTPDDAARRFVVAFDHNHNAKVDLENPSGLPELDERFLLERSTDTETVTSWDPLDFDGDGRTMERTAQRYGIERMTSAKVLFEKADADEDGVVSMPDIAKVLAPYDDNGNGHIDAHEQQRLRIDGLVARTDWSRS